MSRHVDRDPPDRAVKGSPAQRAAVPWAWPESARGLLACLAIVIAIGLLLSGREVRRPGGDDPTASELVLDPNTAPPEALAALPHVGPTLARRLADARAERPFRSVQDLQSRVRGIGPVTLAQIMPYLRVESVRDLDVRTIAGVDDRSSAVVPAGVSARKPPRARPRKSKDASLQLAAQAAGPAAQ